MANCADPDQLASSEASIWIYTVCKGRAYPGSAGLGLKSALAQTAKIYYKIPFCMN